MSRLLVIDDSESIRSTIEAALSKDFAVYCASCGKSGLRAARRRQPDLMLLDIVNSPHKRLR